nr:hypothetical protein [Shewanella gelidimarina]
MVLVFSGLLLGDAAFKAGLPVKRWAFAGFLFGPAAYPLFNSHKQLAYKKSMGKQAFWLEI